MINTLFVSVLQRWDRNLERIGKKQKKNNFMEDVFKLTRCSSFDRYLIKKKSLNLMEIQGSYFL